MIRGLTNHFWRSSVIAKGTFTSTASSHAACVTEIKKVGIVGLGLMGHGKMPAVVDIWMILWVILLM